MFKNIPIYVLIIIAVCIAIGMGFLEMEGAEGESLIGTRVLIWTINLGGIAMFWISADIKRKNKRNGQYALWMSLAVRALAYIYILHISGKDIWLLGQIEDAKISDYISKLMIFGNTVILFCERMVHFYADPSDEFEVKMKAMQNKVKEAEAERKQFEVNMKLNEDAAKSAEDNLKENEAEMNRIKAEMNRVQNDTKKIEASLNICRTQAKLYEDAFPIIEAVVNKPIPYGNTYLVFDPGTKKLKGWKANERKKPLELSTGIKVQYPNKI